MRRAVVKAMLLTFACLLCVGCTNSVKKNSENEMPAIKDIIVNNDLYVALCEDGSVWGWGDNSSRKLGLEISFTETPLCLGFSEKIIQIADGGSAIYALDENGDIYTWGNFNRNKTRKDLLGQTPLKKEGIEKIVQISIKNNRVFALSEQGELYIWGVAFSGKEEYGYELAGFVNGASPKLSECANILENNIKSIEAGAGNYHYFIRNDGTAFSIMEYIYEGRNTPYAFIFPGYSFWNHTELQELEQSGIATVINSNFKEGTTVYYNLSGVTDIDKIASDAYTMFLLKKDRTLFYWDSDRIKYHDDVMALFCLESKIENGNFQEVDTGSILDTSGSPDRIVSMTAVEENVVFLTENGEVFYSYYETYQAENIEIPNMNNPPIPKWMQNRVENEDTYVIENMELKRIAFARADFENIVSVNTDGESSFSLIDTDGNYYVLEFQSGKIWKR